MSTGGSGWRRCGFDDAYPLTMPLTTLAIVALIPPITVAFWNFCAVPLALKATTTGI